MGDRSLLFISRGGNIGGIQSITADGPSCQPSSRTLFYNRQQLPGPLGFGQSEPNLAERQHCALLGWPESLFIPHLGKGPLGIKHKHPQCPKLLQTQTISGPPTHRDNPPRLYPPYQTFIKGGFPSSTSLTTMNQEDQRIGEGASQTPSLTLKFKSVTF